jgi:integrase
MLRPDLYYHEKYLENTMGRIAREPSPEANKRLIAEFEDDAVVNSLSMPTRVRRAQCGLWLTRTVKKPFTEVTKEDLANVLRSIESKSYSENTRYTYRQFTRQFFGHLGQETSWISLKKPMLPTVNEFLTHEDVAALIRSARDAKEKAMIALLYCAGCRTGELLRLERRHIAMENGLLVAFFDGKTGRRRVPVAMPKPWFVLVKQYLRELDRRGARPETRLWPINYKQFSNIFRRLKRKLRQLGAYKRVHPHLFRHSRATYLASFLTEAQLCAYFGWTLGSKTPRVYVHLSGRDLNDAVSEVSKNETKRLNKSRAS